MANRNPLERYFAAGISFTQITRQRAESIVRDLVREGEVGREHAEEWVEELVARSRRSAEQLAGMVRTEVKRQVDALGLMSSDDVVKLFNRLARTGERAVRGAGARADGLVSSAATAGAPKKAAARKSAPRKATAKRAPAKKATAKHAPAKKTAAKKTAATKTTAKRAPAKKTAAKRAPAKKATAKRAPAKKAAG